MEYDISADAVEMSQKNAELNGLEGNMDFLKANVFDLLTEMANSGKCEYDYIILDPPAFTKSSATVKNAERGYKEINMKACEASSQRRLPCHLLLLSLYEGRAFQEDAERGVVPDAKVSLRQIEAAQQAPDHPIL